MTAQQDFWKPKPYDFEALVAEASGIKKMDQECFFNRSGISRKKDTWDNRKKAGAK